MSGQEKGNVALLPEPFEAHKDAVDKAAPAAREAASRITRGHRRRSGPIQAHEPDPAAEDMPPGT
jgi:hypothetical protein